MNVLVTGGTGFVGMEILRLLHNTGHRPHLLTRDPQSPSSKAASDLCGGRVRVGNVLESDSLPKACSGMDAVIHLVGIISEIGEQTFENVIARGTQNMVFAAKNAGVPRFLHMSAIGARAGAASRYHQSKWTAEERVRRSSLGWTIFRPSIIYGPGDGFVNLLAKIIRWSPMVPVFGDGQTKFQPVTVKCVGTAFLKTLAEPRTIGETYDLCGPETLTYEEMLAQIAAVLGRRRLVVHLPIGMARAQARLFETLFPKWLHRPPPLNCDQLVMLQEDNVGNPGPANELFGLRHGTFREGIAAYLK